MRTHQKRIGRKHEPRPAAKSDGGTYGSGSHVRQIAEYLQAFVELSRSPQTCRFSSSECIPAGHTGGVWAMGNATVIAELIAQGRGGLDPTGAGVPVGAGQ
jgi:hypothetical protein